MTTPIENIVNDWGMKILGHEHCLRIDQEAEALAGGLNYLVAHHARTNLSETYTARVYPSLGAVIMDFFFFELVRKRAPLSLWGRDELRWALNLYWITNKVMYPLGIWEPKQKDLKIAVAWAAVLETCEGIRLRDHISSFNGCGSLCEAIGKAWDKYVKASEEVDENAG